MPGSVRFLQQTVCQTTSPHKTPSRWLLVLLYVDKEKRIEETIFVLAFRFIKSTFHYVSHFSVAQNIVNFHATLDMHFVFLDEEQQLPTLSTQMRLCCKPQWSTNMNENLLCNILTLWWYWTHTNSFVMVFFNAFGQAMCASNTQIQHNHPTVDYMCWCPSGQT